MENRVAYKKICTEGGYICLYVHLSLNLSLVHPCDREGKGGCEQVCNKDGVNAKCSCGPAEDFTLNADGKTCDKSKVSILYPLNRR